MRVKTRDLLGFWIGTIAFGVVLGLPGCQSTAPDTAHVSRDPKSAIVDPSKLHPVTPAMRSGADAVAGRPAPAFSLPDTTGKLTTLKTAGAGKPLLVYFINDGCPCCVTAEPLVERIAKTYAGAVQVIGVINANAARGTAWQKANGLTFPLLLDPKMATIQAYGALNGVYMAVVAPNGQLDHLYPGYSQDGLRELSARLAKLAGIPTREFDVQDAPTKPTSGCAFEFAVPEGPTSVSTKS